MSIEERDLKLVVFRLLGAAELAQVNKSVLVNIFQVEDFVNNVVNLTLTSECHSSA